MESWIPRTALEAEPELKPLVEAYDKAVSDYRFAAANYLPGFKQWVADMDKRGFKGKQLLDTARSLIAKHGKG